MRREAAGRSRCSHCVAHACAISVVPLAARHRRSDSESTGAVDDGQRFSLFSRSLSSTMPVGGLRHGVMRDSHGRAAVFRRLPCTGKRAEVLVLFVPGNPCALVLQLTSRKGTDPRQSVAAAIRGLSCSCSCDSARSSRCRLARLYWTRPDSPFAANGCGGIGQGHAEARGRGQAAARIPG